MALLVSLGIMLAFFTAFSFWLDYQDRHDTTDTQAAK